MQIWKTKTQRLVAQRLMRQKRLMATRKMMESQKRRVLEMCVLPPSCTLHVLQEEAVGGC